MIDRILFTASLAALLSTTFATRHVANGADDLAFRQAMADAVRDAAEHVMPSIVSIEVIGIAGENKGEVEQDAPTTGVIVGEDGEILVSSIVVRRPSATILVVLPDGDRKAATVIARDFHRDLVLLKITPDEPLTEIESPVGISTPIGSTTIAIGRYGKDQAPMVSTGILSARERLDGIAIQTDARVPPAMYGGPLIDLYGNFLGLLIPAVGAGGAEDSTDWYDSGIAFAIPADVIALKLDRLRKGEDIKKGLIGIVAGSRDLNEADTTIAAVRARSPAESAGLKAGDKVLTVDGRAVRRHQEIRQVLGRFDAGEDVSMRIARDDQEMDFTIRLTDSIPPLQPQTIGIVVADQAEDEISLIVDAVLPNSPADNTFQVGDRLLKLDASEIDSATSLRRKLISAEPDKEMLWLVVREQKERTLTVTPATVSGSQIGEFPAAWNEQPSEPEQSIDWSIESIKLPDAANSAAYLAPKPKDVDKLTDLGLMVLLLAPGADPPLEKLKSWKQVSEEMGVVVCAVAPEDSARWQPKELGLIAKFAAAVQKKAPIAPAAIAVASEGALQGAKPTAADSMAIAVAISQSDAFFGVAISESARPPAIRLRENEASSSLQILMPVESKDQLPDWSGAIESSGYPLVLGGEVKQADLLRWVRLLQAI